MRVSPSTALAATAYLAPRAAFAAPSPHVNFPTAPRDRIRAYHERQRQDSWRMTEADGTMLGRIAVSATDITAPMQVPDGARAAVFWKKQLPAAGYKISSAKVEKEIGDIKFTGNGCKRGSDIAISGEQVAFFCRR